MFSNSGKSSILERYFFTSPLDEAKPRIESIYSKTYTLEGKQFKLICLDSVGQHAGQSLIPSSILFETRAFILVYSVDDAESFNVIRNIAHKLNEIKGDTYFPRVLVGNKADCQKRRVTQDEGYRFAEQLKCPFIECSALMNKNIDQVFDLAISEIEKERKEESPYDNKSTRSFREVLYDKQLEVLATLNIVDLVIK